MMNLWDFPKNLGIVCGSGYFPNQMMPVVVDFSAGEERPSPVAVIKWLGEFCVHIYKAFPI